MTPLEELVQEAERRASDRTDEVLVQALQIQRQPSWCYKCRVLFKNYMWMSTLKHRTRKAYRDCGKGVSCQRQMLLFSEWQAANLKYKEARASYHAVECVCWSGTPSEQTQPIHECSANLVPVKCNPERSDHSSIQE